MIMELSIGAHSHDHVLLNDYQSELLRYGPNQKSFEIITTKSKCNICVILMEVSKTYQKLHIVW